MFAMHVLRPRSLYCYSKSQIKSLHFAVNSAFRKIFLIKSYDAADECISSFKCSVSEVIHTVGKLNF